VIGGDVVIPSLYLASQSPRRRELLHQIGVSHQVLKVDVPEIYDSRETPVEYVERLAKSKALAGIEVLRQSGLIARPVLGADTIGIIDQHILEKPKNQSDFMRMMQAMSGRSHHVITALAMCDETRCSVKHVITEVYFRQITQQEMIRYWQTGEPCDKAGGYGIQGFAAVFIDKIIGSYSNVVGLPLETLGLLCRDFDCSYWQKGIGDE
jgi:septum formation protein